MNTRSRLESRPVASITRWMLGGALAALVFVPSSAEAQSAGIATKVAAGGARIAEPADAGREAELEREARLETIIRIALARNPDLAEAGARARALRERAPAAGRLPDPEFKYELWGGPLRRPYALDEAQMHMFGLRQMFPAPGSLQAESRALSELMLAAEQMQRARALDVIARVHRAYAEYYRADREYHLYREHAAIAEQIVELLRAMYRAGRGTQQDVLRASVEVGRLQASLAMIERQRRSAHALLNTLMARRADAPLGPATTLSPNDAKVRIRELERQAMSRPEVAAAEHTARSRESEVEAARASGRWPSFMVGLDYQYMPTMHDPHGYGVMFSMSVPWLNPRYGEQVRAAEATLEAERSALSSIRNAARYELYDAVARAEAARGSLEIIDRDVLPRAKQSFEAAQAAYRGGQGDSLGLLDALRSLLDIRIERERALAELAAALADVERAGGRRGFQGEPQ
ncbi:MAG TPA: TolC family protein [Polyangiaceae bacterium]